MQERTLSSLHRLPFFEPDIAQPLSYHPWQHEVRFNATVASMAELSEDASLTYDARIVAASGVMRGLIEDQIKHPDVSHMATLQGLSESLVNIVRGENPQYELPESTLELPVTGALDRTTLEAIFTIDNTQLAWATERLNEGTDIFALGLAHGGVVAAMVTVAALREFHDRDVTWYPVRFSHNKAGDRNPQLASDEHDYIVDSVQSRSLLIVDDDAFTGCTMNQACRFFGNRILKGTVTPNPFVMQM